MGREEEAGGKGDGGEDTLLTSERHGGWEEVLKGRAKFAVEDSWGG